jgi:hypothetical protein
MPSAPWAIQQKIKEKKFAYFSLEGSSHQTGDAAFTPATPQDLQHSRVNSDSQNSHMQHTTAEHKTICFIQKDTQLSQACYEGLSTEKPTEN